MGVFLEESLGYIVVGLEQMKGVNQVCFTLKKLQDFV